MRDASINLRASSQQRNLIDWAVKVLGKSRSDFMLDVACKEAQNVLLDRCYFSLEPEKFDQFLAALDEAPADNDRLRRTLTSPPPWES